MPVAEIVVVPLGAASPSLSSYVAEVEKVIRLCLFQVEGVLRVSTTLKIDERRDRPLTLAGKVRAVEEKLGA
ncbi:MAG: thiamine-binding protein [bacterium]